MCVPSLQPNRPRLITVLRHARCEGTGALLERPEEERVVRVIGALHSYVPCVTVSELEVDAGELVGDLKV